MHGHQNIKKNNHLMPSYKRKTSRLKARIIKIHK